MFDVEGLKYCVQNCQSADKYLPTVGLHPLNIDVINRLITQAMICQFFQAFRGDTLVAPAITDNGLLDSADST